MASKPESGPLPAAAPHRKPMAMARRVSLFEREIRVRLSSPAVDILFDGASVMSEGQVEDDGYFGSTMVTIDVSRAEVLVSDACDAVTARRVADLMEGDDRIRRRARDIAVTEGSARAGQPLRNPQVDVRVRATGAHVQLDVDVEAGVQVAQAPAAAAPAPVPAEASAPRSRRALFALPPVSEPTGPGSASTDEPGDNPG